MEGIAKEDFRWFDQIIVWGRYSKDHLMNISSVYEPSTLLVGANRNTLNDSNEGGGGWSEQRRLLIADAITPRPPKWRAIRGTIITSRDTVTSKPRCATSHRRP